MEITLKQLGKIEDISKHCRQIGVSPDGKYLALALFSQPDSIVLCDLKGKVFKRLEGHRGRVHSIEFAADGRTLASASEDRSVRIWSPTGDLQALFDRFDNAVETISYANDIPILAGGQVDGFIVLFDLAGNYIATLHSPKKRIYSIDWSLDSSHLAAACGDKNLYLFNIKSQLKTVYLHPGPVYGVSFANNNGKLVSSCEDGKLRFINIAEGKIDEIPGHQKRVVDVAFSPDDSLLATASFDKTVKFFDKYGTEKGGHEFDSEALSLTFSPDGKRLFVGTVDKHLHIFDIVVQT
ncbi:MAG: WD40 repeat domain-containing protein [candidate division Zixibacteria bacterium]|nr:WD40 repeat domain-containing protein [candidate division Zixibacteria bacterium]